MKFLIGNMCFVPPGDTATNHQKVVASVLLMCLTCSQGLLMTISKVGGRFPYNVASVPLLAELVKLVVSMGMLYCQRRWSSRDESSGSSGCQVTLTWSAVRLYPVVQVITVVQNSVQYYCMAYVDAATYQILGNAKIIACGVLLTFALRRRLCRSQWLALVLLTMGCATAQVSGCGSSMLAAPLEGYALGLFSAILGATAGVYQEFVMKATADSLHWQNAQLAAFAAAASAARLWQESGSRGALGMASSEAPETGGFLSDIVSGYTWLAWLTVANLALSGILAGWVLKYADTIARSFAGSGAMLLTAVLSIFFLDLAPTLQLVISVVVSACAASLFFHPPELSALQPVSGVYHPGLSVVPSHASYNVTSAYSMPPHAGSGGVDIRAPLLPVHRTDSRRRLDD
ncbi:hypothetical protein PPROV_000653100 [Pycnococcus provasolii]|uniref:CMP-sialic acid transporter n=1 Tax=Pycnococcus provasolii TaxID=41880 RepID=A0A830HS26_9CHLO|nr:hypothetical protein PPROV_000653100 [Pycnococcus provasolii]